MSGGVGVGVGGGGVVGARGMTALMGFQTSRLDVTLCHWADVVEGSMALIRLDQTWMSTP